MAMTVRGMSWVRFLLLLVLALLVILGYAASTLSATGFGFPLDDAWIHQTYARNLGTHGEWAFMPGTPSGGSTSPLWTVLLAIGYKLGADCFLWAWVWGALLLAMVGWVSWCWLEARSPGLRRHAWLAGVLLVLEWHLAWAGASGMETLAQALLAVLTLFAIERRWSPRVQGLLIGVGVWIRPDAVLLLVPVAWGLALVRPRSARSAAASALGVGSGLAVLLLPYLAFNLAFAREILPSTFYAKQAEYESLLGQPLALRLAREWGIGLVGLGAVLAPGALGSVWHDVTLRRWARLAPAVWWVTFLAVYAVRLPVTYQHGRYAMVALPALLVLGTEGMLGALAPAVRRLPWLLTRAWAVAAATVAVAFLGLGARAFGGDVAVINTEMVATARWISANTPEGALIAAHDIGAVGYFSHRQLVDLAGLVTPQVIPILRDETRLAEYLDAQGADYLMTFPGWYPRLVRGRLPVYQSHAPYSPTLGGENMAVYAW